MAFGKAWRHVGGVVLLLSVSMYWMRAYLDPQQEGLAFAARLGSRSGDGAGAGSRKVDEAVGFGHRAGAEPSLSSEVFGARGRARSLQAHEGAGGGEASGGQMVREPLRYSGGVFWWVHLSDVHISDFDDLRTAELGTHFVNALRVIRPPLLLITGDLTDARMRPRTITGQRETEWRTYSAMVHRMRTYCLQDDMNGKPVADEQVAAAAGGGAAASPCGIEIIDLRGNHDTLAVPMRGARGDLYPIFSAAASGPGNKTEAVRYLWVQPLAETVSSMDAVAPELMPQPPPLLFVSLDIAPRTGLRGPANFFAHPLDEDLQVLRGVLSSSPPPTPADESPVSAARSSGSAVKVVFGHYPLAFVGRTPGGESVEEVLHEEGAATYMGGHLHYKFGRRMYRWHAGDLPELPECVGSSALRDAATAGPGSVKEGPGGGARRKSGFWELGTGDWKDSRAIRLMAVDHGAISFVEFPLLPSYDERKKVKQQQQQQQQRLAQNAGAPLSSSQPGPGGQQGGSGQDLTNSEAPGAAAARAGSSRVDAPRSDAPTSALDDGRPLVLVTCPPDPRFIPHDRVAAVAAGEQQQQQQQRQQQQMRVLVFCSCKVANVSASLVECTGNSGGVELGTSDIVADDMRGEPGCSFLETVPLTRKVTTGIGSEGEGVASRRERAEGQVTDTRDDVRVDGGRGVSDASASPLFVGDWDPSKYAGGRPDLWVQVKVVDDAGNTFFSRPQPFVIGSVSQSLGADTYWPWIAFKQTWVERTIIGVDWEGLWPTARWVPFLAFWAVLILALAVRIILAGKSRSAPAPCASGAAHGAVSRAASIQEEFFPWRVGSGPSEFCGVGAAGRSVGGWPPDLPGSPIPETSGTSGCPPVSASASASVSARVASVIWAVLLFPLRCAEFVAWSYVYVAGGAAWWVLLFYSSYLALAPWYWGIPLGPDCPAGHISLFGWAVPTCELQEGVSAASTSSGVVVNGLGVPDIVTTVVPVLYFSFIPSMLLLPLLLAEGGYWRARRAGRRRNGPENGCTPSRDGASGESGECRAKVVAAGESESGPLLTWCEGPVDSASAAHAKGCGQTTCTGAAAHGHGDELGHAAVGMSCTPGSAVQCAVRVLLWSGFALPLLVFIHQTKTMGEAYGPLAVTVSPGFAWFPAIMIAAVVVDRRCELFRNPCKEE